MAVKWQMALARKPGRIHYAPHADKLEPAFMRENVMTVPDTCCTLAPYFKVHEGQLAAFKKGCEAFVEKTRSEPNCLFYGFSFDADEAHCREGYKDAESLLFHLDQNIPSHFAPKVEPQVVVHDFLGKKFIVLLIFEDSWKKPRYGNAQQVGEVVRPQLTQRWTQVPPFKERALNPAVMSAKRRVPRR